MTPAQFDALARLLRLSPGSTSRELARLVLVDGLTQTEAATRLGATPQAAHNAVQRVREGHDLARQAAG